MINTTEGHKGHFRLFSKLHYIYLQLQILGRHNSLFSFFSSLLLFNSLTLNFPSCFGLITNTCVPIDADRVSQAIMATFELYRRSTIGMCLTETLDEMVQNGTLSPELAIQVLVQFDKSMTEALETQVKSKVSIKGHLHTYRFCDNVWTFILQNASFKNEESQENVGRVKIVACDSKLLTQ
ncbi:hypothetical protein RJT34_11947 [Clitoria ternatea]|uniref:Transcription initiation factor IIA subunit 2 n=1 Tax=Clitoria ternatea TaxID=43366 RepID=A0AAN9JNG8_CLITE